MWQNASPLGRAGGARIDAEHHPDDVVSDLDAFDQRADDVALRRPVRRVQPIAHHVGEQAQLADDEPEGAGLFLLRVQRAGLSLEPRRAPAQLRDTRLELGLFDQSLGVAVDEAVGRTTRLGQLAADRVELEQARVGLHHVQAPLILLQHARRVLQQPADLGPHGRIERLGRHQLGVAPALAMELAAVGAAAPVVAPVPAMVMTAERVAALLADEQAA